MAQEALPSLLDIAILVFVEAPLPPWLGILLFLLLRCEHLNNLGRQLFPAVDDCRIGQLVIDRDKIRKPRPGKRLDNADRAEVAPLFLHLANESITVMVNLDPGVDGTVSLNELFQNWQAVVPSENL